MGNSQNKEKEKKEGISKSPSIPSTSQVVLKNSGGPLHRIDSGEFQPRRNSNGSFDGNITPPFNHGSYSPPLNFGNLVFNNDDSPEAYIHQKISFEKLMEREDLVNEEEVIKFFAEQKDQQEVKYNLQENVKLSFTPKKRLVHLSKEKSIMPVMLSVKTSELVKNSKKQIQKIPIDLILVIDKSGSMSGEKESLVKQSIKYLLTILTENDRICLITFENHSEFITPLLKVSDANKPIIEKAIDYIHSKGGTHILSGIEKAFKLINGRQTKNLVTSIFLLSDGQDNNTNDIEERLRNLKVTIQPKDDFMLNTYGYGSDHDAKIMRQIAKENNGNAYYIEKFDKVDEYFVLSLSGILTIVAKNIEITVDFLQNKSVNSPEIRVNKLYGGDKIWKEIVKNKSYKISFSNMLAGVSKDFIFELEIDPSIQNLPDNEKEVHVATAEFKCVNILDKNDVFKKKTDFKLTLLNPNEEVKDNDINNEVELNYLRVKAAEVIGQACKLSEIGEHDQAQNLLENMIDELEISKLIEDKIVQTLMKDCIRSKELCQPNRFEEEGLAYMNKKNSQHMERVSSACEILYANDFQEELMNDLKSKKV